MVRTYTKFKLICFLQKFFRLLLIVTVIAIPSVVSAQHVITGVVKNVHTKEPIYGVAVIIKGTNTGVATAENGQYSIKASVGNTIEFSLLGFKTQEYKVPTTPPEFVNISLDEDAFSLEGVVVESGIMKRNKLGFTGSYTSVSKEDLKRVGGTSVLQSLKSLDPAFIITDNVLSGSDPNVMANIEVRGVSSMNISSVQDEAAVTSKTNQPLFILDGFEATLQEITDLDNNRVESITILKDAGSTAIFGAKGGNGVIVIETIKPKKGEVFVTYTGEIGVGMPDLSQYNMMNASEKLEFERLSGRYGDFSIPSYSEGRKSYYDRLERIKGGVNTYWLSEPLRVGFTNGHTFTISSGASDLLVLASANYKNYQGVMKGSDRETYGANIRLIFRGFEGLNIQNNMTVTGTNASKGSWGNFSDFVNANPYFQKIDENGRIPKYLDEMQDNNVKYTAVNPLYNASLNSRDDTKNFTFTNNTSMEWSVTPSLRINGDLSLRNSAINNVAFLNPSHSQFDNLDYTRKGKYTSRYTRQWSYRANLAANYLKSFDLHNITLIARGNIENAETTIESFSATGFPAGSVGFPSQAFSYEQNSRPYYSEAMGRSVGFIGAFNYNYDYRYLLDINYNIEGSTTFGRNKRFQNFWSVGFGWNINRENFLKEVEWIKELKLRGTYGTNGNQDVNVVTSSVYSYYVGNNVFGQSAYLSNVGNPNLKWQVVEKLSGGIDFSFWKLAMNFDVYSHKTDPQVINLEQRPSTGVTSYSTNMGYLKTQGFEVKVIYNVINIPTNNLFVNLSLTGAHNKSTYGGFNDALENLNEAYKGQDGSSYSLQSLQRYEDGRSPYDLWAMRSMGIDPSNGREIFLTKEGKQTYHFNYNDRVVIANSRPDVEGIISLTFNYKKFQLNTFLRYQLGGHRYNTDLFNKVENITRKQVIFNQDRRALYDRWQKPGDIAEYEGIVMIKSNPETPVSSRFIQKNNILRGESIKVSWDFTGDEWLKAVKLKDLKVNLSMNDFFNLSSIKVERSAAYPFQRSLLLNISARF